MRPDLIGPRPLKPADEICKAKKLSVSDLVRAVGEYRPEDPSFSKPTKPDFSAGTWDKDPESRVAWISYHKRMVKYHLNESGREHGRGMPENSLASIQTHIDDVGYRRAERAHQEARDAHYHQVYRLQSDLSHDPSSAEKFTHLAERASKRAKPAHVPSSIYRKEEKEGSRPSWKREDYKKLNPQQKQAVRSARAALEHPKGSIHRQDAAIGLHATGTHQYFPEIAKEINPKVSKSWFAPFQTDDIDKSLMSGIFRVEDVLKSVYGSEDLHKAEGTAAASPVARRKVTGFEPTQAAPAVTATGPTQLASVGGKTSKITGLPHETGHFPDVSRRSAVSEPGHKLAMARAHLDHHAFEYHRNNQIAGDSTAHPDQRAQAKMLRDEHQRLGTNARKVINSLESQGVKDTKKHHADMVLHYEQNRENPKYAGGVLHPLQPHGGKLAGYHNARSGSEWDKHYGVPEGIAWHNPEVREGYREWLGKRNRTVPEKPATESLKLQPTSPQTGTVVGKVKKSIEMSKAYSSYQKRRMREEAAHYLHHHHLSKIRGNHDEAQQHLDRATNLSKEAGAGPTKKMMQAHINLHKEDWDRAQQHARQAQGQGVQRLTGGAATFHSMAKDNYRAAIAASTHPLVGSKHPQPVEKSESEKKGYLGEVKTGKELTYSGTGEMKPGTKVGEGISKPEVVAAQTEKLERLRPEAGLGAVPSHERQIMRHKQAFGKSLPLRPDTISPRPLRKGSKPVKEFSERYRDAGYSFSVEHSDDDPARVTDYHGTQLKLHSDGTIRHPETKAIHGTYSYRTGDDGRKWLEARPKKEDSVYEA